MKLRGFTTKHILRRALRGIVPASILTRPKMGFPVPFTEWTRGPWHDVVRELLLDRRTVQRGLMDATEVRSLLEGHQLGTRPAGDAIWALVNLELWYRTFIDGEGIQSLPVPTPHSSRSEAGALPDAGARADASRGGHSVAAA
jgi:asparagine synthase (glutamine-hydrolysing)